MKKSVMILIIFLANATLMWGQDQAWVSLGDRYAGRTSVPDGFGGSWVVENIIYVTGTGEDRKEHSVYILRRPSNIYGELPDTSTCLNRTSVAFPTIFPPNVLTGDAIHYAFGDSLGDGFGDGFIESRPKSEALVYWWVDWGEYNGKIKEVAYWFPANSRFASLDPKVFTLHENNLKESLKYAILHRNSKRYWMHVLNDIIYYPTKDRPLLIKG